MEHAAPVLMALGLLVNLILIAVGGTWKLGQLERSLHSAIEKSRKEIDDRIDSQAREFGETASAMRQKIHEVELWARDTFMRRDGFYSVKDELSAEIKSTRDELRADIKELAKKIDTKS